MTTRQRCAADVMTTPVVTVRDDATLTAAIELLLRHHVSGLPVVADDGAVIGIITEHDIMNFAFSGDAADTTVREAMTPQVVSLPPQADLVALVNALSAGRIRRVPIIDNGRLVGIVSRRDILREMLAMYSRY
jgi:CBS domain-containing protein